MISNRVRFVMIGGFAYNLYRNPRATGDIDIIFASDEDNEVTFSEVESTSVAHAIAGLEVPVISPAMLLRNKLAASRAKDLADAEELQAWIDAQQEWLAGLHEKTHSLKEQVGFYELEYCGML